MAWFNISEASRDGSPVEAVEILIGGYRQQQLWLTTEKAAAMATFETLPKALRANGYVSWQGGKWWERTYEHGHFDEGMTGGWTEESFNDDDFFATLIFVADQAAAFTVIFHLFTVERIADPVVELMEQNRSGNTCQGDPFVGRAV